MEAVIDCRPVTRLLFIGLQVLPGDTIEIDRVRAMTDEVEDMAYVAIVDGAHLQRVGRRARTRRAP